MCMWIRDWRHIYYCQFINSKSVNPSVQVAAYIVVILEEASRRAVDLLW